jgi:flavorubredoxin
MDLNGPVELRPGIHWIGVTDPGLRFFDDLYPTDHGTTYNAYVVVGRDKVAVVDTVKHGREEEFFAKLARVVDPARVDYYVVNHTEPDHSGVLAEALRRSPKATVLCSQGAKNFLANQVHEPLPIRVVKEGETVDLGGRTLRFLLVPFLHWPDTIFTHLVEDQVLFSCDAFGAHFCGPSIFADEVPDHGPDVHFYFDGIMRPFKDKVLAAVAKVKQERLALLCPSHGPVVRRDPQELISRYELWSTPRQTDPTLLILYMSPHHNTAAMSEAVAAGAAEARGVRVLRHHVNDLPTPELRDLLEEADALAFGIPTINKDVPPPMWQALTQLSTVKPRGSVAGLFGSYGWSGEACRLAEERLKGLGFKLPVPAVRAQFTPRAEQLDQCRALGRALAEAIAR